MIKGPATMTVSEATVIEAMQAWAEVNFAPGHVPLIEGITPTSGGVRASPTYELRLIPPPAA